MYTVLYIACVSKKCRSVVDDSGKLCVFAHGITLYRGAGAFIKENYEKCS